MGKWKWRQFFGWLQLWWLRFEYLHLNHWFSQPYWISNELRRELSIHNGCSVHRGCRRGQTGTLQPAGYHVSVSWMCHALFWDLVCGASGSRNLCSGFGGEPWAYLARYAALGCPYRQEKRSYWGVLEQGEFVWFHMCCFTLRSWFVLLCFAWPCFYLLCFALPSLLFPSQARLRSDFVASLYSFSVRPQNRQGIEPDPRALTAVFFFQNGAGHFYSRSYGFGVLHAPSMIKKAKKWTQVPQQRSFKLPGTLTRDSAVIPSRRETVLKVTKLKTFFFNIYIYLFVSFRCKTLALCKRVDSVCLSWSRGQYQRFVMQTNS